MSKTCPICKESPLSEKALCGSCEAYVIYGVMALIIVTALLCRYLGAVGQIISVLMIVGVMAPIFKKLWVMKKSVDAKSKAD